MSCVVILTVGAEMVYRRRQSQKIRMRTANIVQRREELMLKLYIEYVLKLCESVMCLDGHLSYGEI